MADTESVRPAADEALIRGYHGIPDDARIKGMSFVQLADLLQSCETGSVKYVVVDREMKKRLANDQAKINLKNVIFGGVFGLIGVALGAYLKSSPPTHQVVPTAAMQQVTKGNTPLASSPPSVQKNEKQSNTKP